MKCTYCGTELDKGYLQDFSQPVQWIPEGKKPAPFKGMVANDAIRLGDGSLLFGYRADAFFCKTCQMVIVPLRSNAE